MVKKLLTSDIPKFISILSNAYPSMDLHKPEIRDMYMKKFEEICKHTKEVKMYGCYREKELLGGMLIYDYKMNYCNHMIDVCGLGTVATDFIHKKEHVAKELVSYFIDYGKKNKKDFLLLYPFNVMFYSKFGFSPGEKMDLYRVKPAHFSTLKNKGILRYLEEPDTEEIIKFYNSFSRKVHGMILKTEMEKKAIFRNPEIRTVGFYGSDGNLCGYVRFSFRKENTGNWLKNSLVIREMLYLDITCLKSIFSFFASQKDQIEFVEFTTVDRDIWRLFEDVSYPGELLIPSVYHTSNIQGIGLMYRTCSVESVLKKFPVPSDFCIEFTVHDPLSGKDEIYTLGRNKKKVSVSMDLGSFSSWSIGSISLEKLVLLGKAVITGTYVMKDIQAFFSFLKPPLCTTSF